jgi:hypothetical protein
MIEVEDISIGVEVLENTLFSTCKLPPIICEPEICMRSTSLIFSKLIFIVLSYKFDS